MGRSIRDGGGEVCAGDGPSSCSNLCGLTPNCIGREKREGWRFSLPGPPSPAHTTTRSHPRDVDKRPKNVQVELSVCQVVRGATHVVFVSVSAVRYLSGGG